MPDHDSGPIAGDSQEVQGVPVSHLGSTWMEFGDTDTATGQAGLADQQTA